MDVSESHCPGSTYRRAAGWFNALTVEASCLQPLSFLRDLWTPPNIVFHWQYNQYTQEVPELQRMLRTVGGCMHSLCCNSRQTFCMLSKSRKSCSSLMNCISSLPRTAKAGDVLFSFLTEELRCSFFIYSQPPRDCKSGQFCSNALPNWLSSRAMLLWRLRGAGTTPRSPSQRIQMVLWLCELCQKQAGGSATFKGSP